MPLPESAVTGDGRLRGLDICNYMEKFTDKFLIGKAKFHFETEVLNIERDGDGNWNVAVEDLLTKSLRTLTFSRIILATGVSRTNFETIYLQYKSPHITKGCSNPKIPAEISQSAADKMQFHGIVLHSSQFATHLDKILEAVKPVCPNSGPDDGEVVLVVGGGKSAQELVTFICIPTSNTHEHFSTNLVWPQNWRLKAGKWQ